MNKRLIVFDVDGVLLNNKMGGFKDILILLEKEKDVQIIDEEYQKRKHVGPWGMEQLAELYQGFYQNRLRELAIKYCQKNLTKGVTSSLAKLKKRGYVIGALSSNPQFIMDVLTKELPLDFSEGTRLEFKEGVATGRIQRKVDRYIKAEILQKKIKDYQSKKEDTIVVGDSITDIPMAELAGTFIAFCPKQDIVKEKANLIVANFQQLKLLL